MYFKCKFFAKALIIFLTLFLVSSTLSFASSITSASAGDYKIEIGKYGPIIYYENVIISENSYFYLWKAPGYGERLGGCNRRSWEKCLVKIVKNKEEEEIIATLKNENDVTFKYSAIVSKNGIKIIINIKVPKDIAVGQKEYCFLAFPAKLIMNKAFEANGEKDFVPQGPEEREVKESKKKFSKVGKIFKISSTIGEIEIEGNTDAWLYDACFHKNTPSKFRSFWLFHQRGLGKMGKTNFEKVIEYKIKVNALAMRAKKGALTIQDGKTEVAIERIILPKNSTFRENECARELVNYIKQIFNKELVISHLNNVKKKGSILLGNAAIQAGLINRNELKKIAPDGYIIVSKKGCLGIAGCRDVGTLYGVYAFLKKLGVKFYADDCEIVPEIDYFNISSFIQSNKPAFDFRGMPYCDERAVIKLGYSSYNDFPAPANVDPNLKWSKWNWGHTSDYLCPVYKYHKTHPEYFARDENNKNYDIKRSVLVHLCFSNTEVRKIAAQRALEWIEKYPNAKYFCISQGDGPNWCRCKNCTALDPFPGMKMQGHLLYLSDRLLNFVNYIAEKVEEKYPDKIILTLAYFPETQRPAVKIKPKSNVRIMFCPYPMADGAYCQNHDLFCLKNKGALSNLKGWLAWCPNNMYIFDYPSGYVNRCEPFGSFYAMINKIRFYSFCNIKGIFFCRSAPMVFRKLFDYVMGELVWQPEQDVEKLVDDFFPAYYGKASPHMRQFFNLFYNTINNVAKPIHQTCERRNPGVVSPGFAKKAYLIFTKAKEAVKSNPVLLSRVEFEEFCGVIWADLNENRNKIINSNGELNKEILWKLKQLAKIHKRGQIRGTHGFKIRGIEDKDWISKIVGFTIKTYPWYEDPLINEILFSDSHSKELIRMVAAKTESMMILENTRTGIKFNLLGFQGAIGPQKYSYQCPPREAIWILAKRPPLKDNTIVSTFFYLKNIPSKATLILDALDDDKPGATRIEIYINGKVIFSGKNKASENDWTTLSFPIPVKIFKKGQKNSLKIINLETTSDAQFKWFMISKARIQF